MKAQRQTLHNKSSKGGWWDFLLFSAIKKHPERPDVKRVETMLTLLVDEDRLWLELESLGSRFQKIEGTAEANSLAHQFRASKRARARTLKNINEALQRYQWRARLPIWDGDVRFHHEFYCVASPEVRHRDWEGGVVAQLLELAKRPGALSRFRRCSECQKWFYAITGHQYFCGESCRRRHAAQDPEFKEKRRIYMAERYRPLQKELQERSKRLVSGKNDSKGRG